MSRQIPKLVVAACLIAVGAWGRQTGAQAASLTPKHVTTDVTQMLGAPTTDYVTTASALNGKNTDDTSMDPEYWEQRYLFWLAGSVSGRTYSGPSNYLVLSVGCNGLNGLRSFPEGRISFEIDGAAFQVAVPAFTFTDQAQYIGFYIADDGSTYYAQAGHLPRDGGLTGPRAAVDLSPSQAFAPEHLAAVLPEPSAVTLLAFGGLLMHRRPRR